MPIAANGKFWAITAYFNPAEFRNRLQNYHVFRDQLNIPLITVELAFDGSFQLQHGDADILIQVRGGDVMWQKERLLNIALRSLPSDCQKFAWLDCDVVFLNRDWAHLTMLELDRVPLLQPFEEIIDLLPNQRPGGHVGAPIARWSLASKLSRHALPESIFYERGSSKRWNYAPGLAWAARREIFGPSGFYDGLIVGAFDKALVSCVYDRIDAFAEQYALSEAHKEDYVEWTSRFQCRSHIGFVPGKLCHLWHGNLARRKYTRRYVDFQKYHFDPKADLSGDQDQPWRWNSPKAEMHRYVADYFVSRREDSASDELSLETKETPA